MKKLLLLISLCLALSLFCGCDSASETVTDESGNAIVSDTTDKNEVDIDFTKVNDPYNTILNFMTNPSDYHGKRIAVEAQSSVIYNFTQNKIDKHIMLGIDPTGCCNSYYEIRSFDGAYPQNGINTRFVGDFTENGYITLSNTSEPVSTAQYEIDAINMSATELEGFIKEYSSNYTLSEFSGKTIRIFGHHQTYNGYLFLIGLTGEGAQRWIIELYDPTGSLSFPVASGNLVNPVEIIGTLSFYTEGDKTYACITVTEVNRVECVFK